MRTSFFLLGVVLLGCGSSEPIAFSSSGSGGDSSSAGSTGGSGPDRGDAGECDLPVAGGLEVTISAPSTNSNVETRHLLIDPAPITAKYGTSFCTKGCTDITGGCNLAQSNMKTCATVVVSIAGPPMALQTYTIIPAKTGSDENGNPGLPTKSGYVAFAEGPCGLPMSRYWIATSGTLKIDEVSGPTVKFSFTGLAMNQDSAEKSESQGTFTMDGSGTAQITTGK
jgi:hypothetical protein